MAVQKKVASPPTFWEREAGAFMRDLLRKRRVKYKELTRALESFGEDIPPTTLSNKVNRGKFPLAFFIQCLYAMHLADVRFVLPGMSEADLAEVRAAAKRRTKRKPPEPKVSMTGTTNSVQRRRR